MAVTKFWPVRTNLLGTIEYAVNPEKTAVREVSDDLGQVLAYVQDGEKTEKLLYVSGVNCRPGICHEQFVNVKQQYAKTDGILAWHGYMSFAPGEVTADQAHAIGLEVAKKLWGERYQVVVTTHLNTHCLHNHFVVNSVSFLDGKRLREKAWFLNHRVVDEICREHALSVVERPERNPDPKNLVRRDRAGQPTRYNVLRQAIDEAINRSSSVREFTFELQKMGYSYRISDNRKYWSVIPKGYDRPIRLYRLGEEYTNERIQERLMENRERVRKTYPDQAHQKRVVNTAKPKRKVGLYLHYCYRLGILPKRKQNHARLHYLLREDLMKLDEITKEVRFLGRNHIETEQELMVYKAQAEAEVKQLTLARKRLRNEARQVGNADRVSELRAQASRLTKRISFLKKELTLTESVAERSGIIRERLAQVSADEVKAKRKEKNKDVQWR